MMLKWITLSEVRTYLGLKIITIFLAGVTKKSPLWHQPRSVWETYTEWMSDVISFLTVCTQCTVNTHDLPMYIYVLAQIVCIGHIYTACTMVPFPGTHVLSYHHWTYHHQVVYIRVVEGSKHALRRWCCQLEWSEWVWSLQGMVWWKRLALSFMPSHVYLPIAESRHRSQT